MPASNRSPDICIVGGGIVGLWTAFFAARQGLAVTLVEKHSIGAGASGGILGALMPHQPNAWTAKKQFQLDGLLSLPREIALLEDMTGLSAGYRRCGRLMPIRHAEKRRQSGQWADGSAKNWPTGHDWQIIDASPVPEWLPQTQCPHGLNHDTLSARIDPRALLSMLVAAIGPMGIDIREGTSVEQVERDGTLRLSDGDTVAPGYTTLTAGWQTFPLLDSHFPQPTGRGVKGQAALLKPISAVDPATPIIYDNGTYVIAHDNGLVAIGSTSENDFEDPASTDDQLDTLIATAKALCPALEGAETVERWAGVRPRAAGREPLVGPLPGLENMIVVTGGFKITFAIAHLMAKAALAQAAGESPAFLPEIFLPENRLTRSS